MKLFSIRLLTLFVFLSHLNVTYAELEKGRLIKGKVIASEINPTEKHRYSIKLKKNKFALIRLLQKGVDVSVTTYDPDGKKIEEFDSPNGKNGFELFSISSVKKGNYAFEVFPIGEDQTTGRYELIVETIKPKAISSIEQMDELFALEDDSEAPGLAVAVIKGGEVEYKKGFGLANLEFGIPIASSTVFDIASLAKQFTGFGISLLIEQGKISLDDDIRQYIPEFPDFGHTVTIAHLVHHTSGLRDWPNALAIKGKHFGDIISFEEIMSMIYAQQELNFIPGSEFMYSNSGYNVLAELIQRVTGESFREWAETHIFLPLEMNDTHFHDDHTEVVENKASGYYFRKEGYHVSSNNLEAPGSSSLYTTLDDLINWSINFHNPKVGNETIIKRMTQKGVLNNGEEISYAFGLDVGEYNGIKNITHTGGWASFRTYSGYFPGEDLSVIILSNKASFNSGKVINKIADIWLENKTVKTLEIKEAQSSEVNSVASLNEKTLEVLSQTQLPGNYELEVGVVLEITIKDDVLHVFQTWNKKTYNLINTIGNTYEIPDDDSIQFTFSKLKGDATQLVTVFQRGQDSAWNRLEAFDTAKVNLGDFSGRFYSEELSTAYDLVVVDDKLVAKHSRLSDIVLDPIKKDFFTGEVWFLRQVKFVRDTAGVISGFKVTNGRVRNLHFEKVIE